MDGAWTKMAQWFWKLKQMKAFVRGNAVIFLKGNKYTFLTCMHVNRPCHQLRNLTNAHKVEYLKCLLQCFPFH